MTYDLNTQLSPHYTLADLCATSQVLTEPNFPDQDSYFNNLIYTADMLEQLDSSIGPFQLLSGFRTKELEDVLTAKGEPTAQGTSFHQIGRAIDITPTTMSITEYFGRILSQPGLSAQFAEIAIKPSQNAIHLAINTPDDVRTTKVLGLNDQGQYTSLDADQIKNYIVPYEPSSDAADQAAAALVTYDKTPLILALVAGVGGIAFLYLKSRKTA